MSRSRVLGWLVVFAVVAAGIAALALEATPQFYLPTGATARVRQTNTQNATLYALTTGKRLWVTSLWISAAGSTTAGTARITTNGIEGDASTIILLEVEVPASAAGVTSVAVSGLAIPLSAALGQQLSTASSGLTGASTSFGFSGWEEPLTK
jgi:4-amino-4-deoxy-L-arabinose transferase-like glycosyltransferase